MAATTIVKALVVTTVECENHNDEYSKSEGGHQSEASSVVSTRSR